MMKIAVNARLLRVNKMDGIGWFTYNTVKNIIEKNPQVEFHLFFDSGVEKEFLFGENVIAYNLKPPAKHAFLNLIWFEWSLKKILNKINPDIFISPDGIACLGWKGKQYVVIHDINFHHYPKDLKWSNRLYYKYIIPRSAKKADRIGTVSQYSKSDIVNTYGVDADKIDVLYNGINSFFRPLEEAEKQNIKRRYAGGSEYFFYIGTLHPRKNILRLLQAFEKFKSSGNHQVKLLLAGKPLYRAAEIFQYHRLMEYRDDVIFLGHLGNEELNQILASAYCLTFVPYFEGFGIPIIEAFKCEVPVICSNTTSLPEVAGNAALYVDPFNISEITNAMNKIFSDTVYRSELIIEGSKRKSLFTWMNTSNLLWEGISKVI